MHILKTGAAGFMVQLGSSLYQAEFDLDLKNRSNLVLLKKKKNCSEAYSWKKVSWV